MKILKRVMNVIAAVMMCMMMAFSSLAADEVVYTLPVKVDVTVESGIFSGETFTVKLESVSGTTAWSTEKTLTLDKDHLRGQVSFEGLRFSAPGEHVYNVSIRRTGGSVNLKCSGDTTLSVHAVVSADGQVQLYAVKADSSTQTAKEDLAFHYVYRRSSSGNSGTGGSGSHPGILPGGSETTASSETEESGQVLGVDRTKEAPESDEDGTVKGVGRRKPQTGDESKLLLFGVGFIGALTILLIWICIRFAKKEH